MARTCKGCVERETKIVALNVLRSELEEANKTERELVDKIRKDFEEIKVVDATLRENVNNALKEISELKKLQGKFTCLGDALESAIRTLDVLAADKEQEPANRKVVELAAHLLRGVR